jgi:hypothetical protein
MKKEFSNCSRQNLLLRALAAPVAFAAASVKGAEPSTKKPSSASVPLPTRKMGRMY